MRYYLLLSIFIVLVSCNSQETINTSSLKEIVKPNIIFVMVDDLGTGDLGVYGQKVINTPNLNKMAQEGRVYTNCYAGSPVCAPSRSTLMTGKHTGHTTVRGNKSQIPVVDSLSSNPIRVPLLAEDVTIAELLKTKGYVTGMFGKWGLGERGSVGEPNDQGFDEWLGYLNQKRAHNHYVDYFWHNKDTFKLEGNSSEYGIDSTYSHHLFTDYALDFITTNKDTSFFLYLPYCLPHNEYQIPTTDTLKFSQQNWTSDEKVYAAMVEKLDADIGKLLQKLKEENISEQTLVFFCSDNGAAQRWEGRFYSSGGLKGRKRDMYEGGIRVPMIIWMPETVPAGTTSDLPFYFPDIMPTLASVTKTVIPTDIDGVDIWNDIQGKAIAIPDRFMYWEFHEGGFYQAVRWKDWKGIRKGLEGKLELYNLSKDISEEYDIASKHPEIVKSLEKYLVEARTESPYWLTNP